jgi:type I restriction enzyme S subunit
VKAGWQIKKLGEICEIERGGSPRPIQNFITTDAKGINWIKIGDATASGKHIYRTEEKIKPEGVKRSRMVYEGDFILSNSMSFGRPYIMRTSGCIHDGWLVLRQPKVDPDYLYYVLSSDLVFNQFDQLAAGSTVRNLNIGLAKSVEIPYPPLAEQRRIVGILDEAFEGITAAKANAEKNLQNAHALFESHLQSTFAQGGPGWVKATIGETCTLKSGTTVSPTLEVPAGDIPYLKVADMTFDGSGDGVRTSSRFLNKADVKHTAIIPKGATIFPKRGGAILTNKKRITLVPICADLNIMAVLPSARIEPELLYFYFLHVDMRKLGTGSSIPQINNYDIAPLSISFPDSSREQRTIIRKLEELRAATAHLARLYERKVEALEALKKSLLHQAFIGELTAQPEQLLEEGAA